jgi:hypothetical protein
MVRGRSYNFSIQETDLREHYECKDYRTDPFTTINQVRQRILDSHYPPAHTQFMAKWEIRFQRFALSFRLLASITEKVILCQYSGLTRFRFQLYDFY